MVANVQENVSNSQNVNQFASFAERNSKKNGDYVVLFFEYNQFLISYATVAL